MNVLAKLRQLQRDVDWMRPLVAKIPSRIGNAAGSSGGGSGSGSGGSAFEMIDTADDLPVPSQQYEAKLYKTRDNATIYYLNEDFDTWVALNIWQ